MAKACNVKAFRDPKSFKCVTPDMMYKFISKRDTIEDDIKIEKIAKKYSKKQLIDELDEFDLKTPAKHIINMFCRKKVKKVEDTNKRVIAFASYWLNKYRSR